MGKNKTIDVPSFPDSEKGDLIQEIRRQLRQKVSEERLARSLLYKKISYPNGISVTVEEVINAYSSSTRSRNDKPHMKHTRV